MNIIDSVKMNEGFEAKPYIDPLAIEKIPADEYAIIVKNWDDLKVTFGHGHTYISKKGSETLIVLKIERIKKVLSKKIDFFTTAPIEVQDVLCEMAYQMGVYGLLKFHNTLHHLKHEYYEMASAEMLDSIWAREQTSNRARELSSRILDLNKNNNS